jgi:hypothetical protein
MWHWEAPHPDWSGPENEMLRQRLATTAETPSKAGVVSSYAIDNGDQVLLFDPLAVPREIVELAADRETAIVMTCPWHERDTRSLAERLGTPVFVPPPDEGSPDVAWLVAGETVEGHLFSAGDRLPLGIGWSHLVVLGDQIPRGQRLPRGSAYHVVERGQGQRLLHGVHDLRFDRVDIGGEVTEEIVLGEPGEALRVDIDIRHRRGRRASL